eukprot:2734445-Rhodomonas_salina.3
MEVWEDRGMRPSAFAFSRLYECFGLGAGPEADSRTWTNSVPRNQLPRGTRGACGRTAGPWVATWSAPSPRHLLRLSRVTVPWLSLAGCWTDSDLDEARGPGRAGLRRAELTPLPLPDPPSPALWGLCCCSSLRLTNRQQQQLQYTIKGKIMMQAFTSLRGWIEALYTQAVLAALKPRGGPYRLSLSD